MQTAIGNDDRLRGRYTANSQGDDLEVLGLTKSGFAVEVWNVETDKLLTLGVVDVANAEDALGVHPEHRLTCQVHGTFAVGRCAFHNIHGVAEVA